MFRCSKPRIFTSVSACGGGTSSVRYALVFLLQIGFLFGPVAAQPGLEVEPPIAESRFGPAAPPGWQLEGEWALTPQGALADSGCSTVSSLELPENCLVEMIFNLPAAEKLQQKVTASISVGPADDEANRITASAEYQKVAGEKPACPYTASLSGTGHNGKRVSTKKTGDMRPALVYVLSGPRVDALSAEAKAHNGWVGKTVSLGVTFGEGLCRLLVNGNVVGEITASVPSKRVLSVAGVGIRLRAVRVLRGIPRKYAIFGGGGLALLNDGASEEPVTGVALDRGEIAVVEIDGVPFAVHGAGEGTLAAFDVAAESWQGGRWSEGAGMPMAPLLHRWYTAAHLLLHAVP